jgi:hypothetical protein
VGSVIARGKCDLKKTEDKIDNLVDVTEGEEGEEEQVVSGKLDQ